jgi:hypothetical protein
LVNAERKSHKGAMGAILGVLSGRDARTDSFLAASGNPDGKWQQNP